MKITRETQQAICEWMQPGHEGAWHWREPAVPGCTAWVTCYREIELNALHEAEEKLTDRQWQIYQDAIYEGFVNPLQYNMSLTNSYIHAGAADKAAAMEKAILDTRAVAE